ncbi:MAG: hypothetical protein Q9196_006259 [Gyalolechia fulgens]
MAIFHSEVPITPQPWGPLAAERYIPHQRNPNSSEGSDQQRERSMKGFVGAAPRRTGYFDDWTSQTITPPLSPDARQPLGTPVQQESVAGQAIIPTVWLRTCYSTGSDRRHEELVRSAKLFDTVDDKHRILNDSVLYNFGDEWEQVFDACPQLLEPDCGNWKERQLEARDALRRFREGGPAGTSLRGGESLSYFAGEEVDVYVAQALQSDVHKAFVVSRIVLEDEESLETGEVAVMFVDASGRIVRMKRIGTREAQQMEDLRVDGNWDDVEEWEEAELGEEYETGSDQGRLHPGNAPNEQRDIE